MTKVWIMGLTTLLASLCGCGPTLRTTGPIPAGQPQPPGLRYHLAKDVIAVSGTTTWSYDNAVKMTGGSETEEVDFRLKATTKYVSTTIQPSVVTVADPSSYHILNVEPRGFKDQTLTIAIGDSGLLTSVNYTTTDKTGETVTNVGKAIASVAGAFFGFRGAETTNLSGTFAQLVAKDLDLYGPNPSEEMKVALKKRFVALPGEIAYLVTSGDRTLRRLWFTVARTEIEIQFQSAAINARLLDAATEQDPDKVKRLQSEIDYRSKLIGRLAESLTADRAVLNTLLEKGRSEEKLGVQEITRPVEQVIEVVNCPSFEQIEDCQEVSEILKALDNFPQMKSLFKEARVVVTVDRVDSTAFVADSEPDRTPPATDTTPESAMESKTARIYYRALYPAIIRVLGLRVLPVTGEGGVVELKERVVVLTKSSVQIVDTSSPPSFVEFNPKAFSNQSVSLGFNAKGQLTSASQGATSSLAGAAAAAANTVTGVRDEFASSLVKAKDIITTKQQIDLSDLDFKINELTKRKAIIDQRLALAGATANYEIMLEKQQLDQQLLLLQTQHNLVKAQQLGESTLEQERLKADVATLTQQLALLRAQQNLEKTQQLGKTTLEQEKLKADVGVLTQQVELLKQQIELLKKQKEFGDLNNPPE